MSTQGRVLTVELLTSDEEELVFAIERMIDGIVTAKLETMLVGAVLGMVTLPVFVFFSGFSFEGIRLWAIPAIQFGVFAGSAFFGGFLAHILYFRRRSARKIAELRRWAADPRTCPTLEKLAEMDKAAGALARFESVSRALKDPSPLVARQVRRLSLSLPE